MSPAPHREAFELAHFIGTSNETSRRMYDIRTPLGALTLHTHEHHRCLLPDEIDEVFEVSRCQKPSANNAFYYVFGSWLLTALTPEATHPAAGATAGYGVRYLFANVCKSSHSLANANVRTFCEAAKDLKYVVQHIPAESVAP